MMALSRSDGLAPEEVLSCVKLYVAIMDDVMETLQWPKQHLRQFRRSTPPATEQAGELVAQLLRVQVLKDQKWVLSDDDRRPFSFLRCCEALKLNPEAVRDRWRKQGLLDLPADVIAAGNVRPRLKQRRTWIEPRKRAATA